MGDKNRTGLLFTPWFLHRGLKQTALFDSRVRKWQIVPIIVIVKYTDNDSKIARIAPSSPLSSLTSDLGTSNTA